MTNIKFLNIFNPTPSGKIQPPHSKRSENKTGKIKILVKELQLIFDGVVDARDEVDMPAEEKHHQPLALRGPTDTNTGSHSQLVDTEEIGANPDVLTSS